MPNSLQDFLARGIQKAAEDLEGAFLRLPEDKRAWSPMGSARTALDQVAEVALLNGSTAELMRTRTFKADFDFAKYEQEKTELAKDWNKVQALLHENTPKAAEAVKSLSDDDLAIEVQMPWGPMTLAQIASYPFWNACYHEGQINYIASMLGCLE